MTTITDAELIKRVLDRTAHYSNHTARSRAIGVNHQTVRNWLSVPDVQLKAATRSKLRIFLGLDRRPAPVEVELLGVTLTKAVGLILDGWPDGRDEVLTKLDALVRILETQRRLDGADVLIWDAYLLGLGWKPEGSASDDRDLEGAARALFESLKPCVHILAVQPDP
jgi:hypothetical protein